MRYLSFSFVFRLLLGLLVGACHSQSAPSAAPAAMPPPTVQTEKFRLDASPGCPEGYPATIEEGRFINSAGGGFPLPYGHFLDGDWTGTAIGWAVGEEMQAVPDSLELRWFSYTEDKFYEGHFLLPQQHIYDLLKQGYWDKDLKQRDTYSGFTASVLPTGVVLVWLDGGNQAFLGRYQAREVQYDFARFLPQADRAQVVREAQKPLSPAVKHEIATRTLSPKKWDAYLKTYPWQLAFSQPLTLTDFGIGLRNGESVEYPPTPDLAAYTQAVLAPSRKGVPEDAMLYVAGAYGRKKLFKVEDFDEHETLSAFQALAARHPGQPLTLHVETNEQLTKAALSLRAGKDVIPLTKSPVQLFDL